MTNEISINTASFLNLDTNIRISSTSSFNAESAFESVFEDVVMESVSEKENENKNLQINFSNLGAPPGFWIKNDMGDFVE